MTATNHALTGAILGLAVGNPWVALPAAFVSHFVCDAIPHYDVSHGSNEEKIASRTFFYVQIVGGLIGCVALVAVLVISQPAHWLLACICAFLAASPDLLAIPRFQSVKRGGKDLLDRWWFWRFHHNIQWFQKPIGWPVELAWFAGALILIRPFMI
ncbi:MAG TPA: hypothetical protein VHB51_02990 [Candidatus Saccharimonadales bacterium]|nr:hypothetical protein [Candidatus Saccharimonadales bacterium]